MAEIYLTAYKGAFLGPIAKALGWIMNGIYKLQTMLGIYSIPLAIVLFTIFIYLLLYPLTYRQQKFSVLSAKMSPEIKAIQAKYKGRKDQASMLAMQEETQSVYDKYGISMAGSCGQLIIQMPILFALYRVFLNIPAYIGSVRRIFDPLVDGIVKVDGYGKIIEKVMSSNSINVAVDFSKKIPLADQKNYIVDVLYKLSDQGWAGLTGKKFFPDLGSSVDAVQGELHKVNYIFGINISDTPLHLIQNAAASGAVAIIILALLFPIVSYLSQLINIKVSQSSKTVDENMARQMRTMNILLPLMSLVFGFTLPVGLTFYWIIGAFVRTGQTLYLNKKFEKIDLDEIIEKNKEKAAKKKAKRGVRQAQIYEAAKMNTRNNSLASRAAYNNASNSADASGESATPKKYKEGSLAAKANLVNEYNHKNTK